MSFLHSSATPVVRSRRTKDGGSRNVVVGIARRRETSKSHEDKSTTSTQSTAGDALSIGDADAEGSVSSPPSPDSVANTDERSQKIHEASVAPFPEAVGSSQPVTPIALRQYLEHDSGAQASRSVESDTYQSPYVMHEDSEHLAQAHETTENRMGTSTHTAREGTIVQVAESANMAQSSRLEDVSTRYHTESDPAPMERGLPLQHMPLLVPSPWESPLPSYLPASIHPQPHEQFRDHTMYFGFEDRVETPRLGRGEDATIEPLAAFSHQVPSQSGIPYNQLLAYGPPPPTQHNHFDFHHENEDIVSTLHQVNHVLPKLEAFLEQEFAPPTNVDHRRAENQMVKRRPCDVSSGKEPLKKTDKSVEKLRAQLEEERKTLQDKLEDAYDARSHLESCLHESKERERKLHNDVEELRRARSEAVARSRQSEAALESFIQWLLRQSESKQPTGNSEAQTVYITERASEDHLKVAVHSMVASVPQSHNNSRNGSSPENENPPIPGSFCEVLPRDEHCSSNTARSETQPVEESALSYSPWLSHGWETAATNSRVKILEEDLARLRNETEEHRRLLVARHEEEKHDLRALIDASETRYEKRCRRLHVDNTALCQENELLRARIASQQAWSVQSTLEVRECVARVDRESRTLRKVLEANLATSSAFKTRREDR